MFPHYMFRPLDQHYDYGFGALGEAFRESAIRLHGTEEPVSLMQIHLPINFLFRHSIELFLKSLIVLIHRSLDIPFGNNDSNGPPHVQIEGKWKPIYKIHGILVLFRHLKSVALEHKDGILSRTGKVWGDAIASLESQINFIDSVDARSTYFRYPNLLDPDEDAAKSTSEETTVEKITSKMSNSDSRGAFLLYENDQGDITKVYEFKPNVLEEFRTALMDCSEKLGGLDIAIRMEMAGGK